MGKYLICKCGKPCRVMLLTNDNKISIETENFLLQKTLKTNLKLLSTKWWPFCCGLSVLNVCIINYLMGRFIVPSFINVIDFFCQICYAFSNFTHWQSRLFHICIFPWIILKHSKDIYCPHILKEFDDGGSVLLNVCVINHSMIRLRYHFIYFQSNVFKFVWEYRLYITIDD